ncbi:Txe/YoeB family addiction module toxin [Raineya sp.]|jgi:toxin YoeB
MTVEFSESAYEDLMYFKEFEPAIYEKIQSLLENIKSTPFQGIGKPEPLKYDLQGYWSRRITILHRLVYKVESERIVVIQCRGHY